MDIADQSNITLVNTVADNSSKYTSREYSQAVLARKLHRIIGRPGTRFFMNAVDKHLIPNCPITRKDILAAEDIFGPDVGILKGKTVRRNGPRVTGTNVTIPDSLMQKYRQVILAGDIMFVNKIPFLVTISRHIKFCTTQMLSNQKATTIFTAIHMPRFCHPNATYGWAIRIALR